ncbi:MAG: SPOR domain-containing protein [Pseudohongiellaceae bacterium]
MKQRLVGTIVLGCLALILIPMLLDGEGMVEPLPMVVSMPSAPEINLTPLPEPERPTIIADSLPADIPLPDVITGSTEISSTDPALTSDLESAQPTTAQPTTAQPTLVTTPKLNTQGLPEAWSVKLGTFSDRTNAESLVATLILANHKAYSRPVKTDTQNLIAVFVGPVLTPKEAANLQQILAKEYQLTGIVEQFTIDAPISAQ